MATTASVDTTTTLQRNEHILSSPVGQEMLILSVEQGGYFVLSPVTARIWELLESPKTVTDVVTALEQEYEVAPEVCRTEVIDVLQGLTDQGLVQASAS
jgi:hypothetical protein